MKTPLKLFVIYLCISCFCCSSFAQVLLSTHATNAGGNSFRNSEIQFDWSIGEMVVTNTSFTPEVIISKGILQPSRPKITSNDIFVGLKLFPTITKGNQFSITGSFDKPYSMSLRLLNNIGQQLAFRNYQYSLPFFIQSTELPVLTPGSYFIEVTLNSAEEVASFRKTFRIQKQ